MKFVYSFFVTVGLVFGFAPEAEANRGHDVVRAAYKSCSVHKQWVRGHYTHHGHWVAGHYKYAKSCHSAPKVVVYKPKACHHSHHSFHHSHPKPNLKLVIRI